MKAWIAFWNILKKRHKKNYYLKPPNISWGIIFPLSWTLMQVIRSPDGNILNLLPGLISMSVLFGTTSMLAVTITFERSGRSFERLLLAPISLGTMVLAKIAGTILFGIFNAFVPVILRVFFINLSAINWTIVFFAVLMISITSALMGLLIAVSAEQVFEAQTLSNFFFAFRCFFYAVYSCQLQVCLCFCVLCPTFCHLHMEPTSLTAHLWARTPFRLYCALESC